MKLKFVCADKEKLSIDADGGVYDKIAITKAINQFDQLNPLEQQTVLRNIVEHKLLKEATKSYKNKFFVGKYFIT